MYPIVLRVWCLTIPNLFPFYVGVMTYWREYVITNLLQSIMSVWIIYEIVQHFGYALVMHDAGNLKILIFYHLVLAILNCVFTHMKNRSFCFRKVVMYPEIQTSIKMRKCIKERKRKKKYNKRSVTFQCIKQWGMFSVLPPIRKMMPKLCERSSVHSGCVSAIKRPVEERYKMFKKRGQKMSCIPKSLRFKYLKDVKPWRDVSGRNDREFSFICIIKIGIV